ncbi:hypothetical protein DL96DRAFT_1818469 [Flagelloscypha sp. PMI_526]|nr:hypothetical protein DL96DRAFT_1818469 [Flagelloscypha sp. PMI_526]
MAVEEILSRSSTFSSVAVASDSSTITYDYQQGVGRTVYSLMRSAGDRVEVFADRVSTWRRPSKPNLLGEFQEAENSARGISFQRDQPLSFQIHVLKRNQLRFTRHGGFMYTPDTDDQEHRFLVRGDESYGVFKSKVAQSIYAWPSDSVRLLMLVRQWNRVRLVNPPSGSATMGDLVNLMNPNQPGSTITRFYIQTIPDVVPFSQISPHVLVFLGQYDSNKTRREYRSVADFWQVYIPQSSSAAYINNLLKKREKIEQLSVVNLYLDGEKIFQDMLHQNYIPISGKLNLYDGAVIWYHVVPEPFYPLRSSGTTASFHNALVHNDILSPDAAS